MWLVKISWYDPYFICIIRPIKTLTFCPNWMYGFISGYATLSDAVRTRDAWCDGEQSRNSTQSRIGTAPPSMFAQEQQRMQKMSLGKVIRSKQGPNGAPNQMPAEPLTSGGLRSRQMSENSSDNYDENVEFDEVVFLILRFFLVAQFFLQIYFSAYPAKFI